jgi:hypothetical protein
VRLPEKRWHFVAVASPDVFVATAIAHLGYLGVGFAYAYDRTRGVVHRGETKVPLALGVRVARAPNEPSSFSMGGLRLAYDPSARLLRIRVRAFGADLRIEPAVPRDAAWDTSAGAHRTRKAMGGRANGRVRLAHRVVAVEGSCLIDWSRGHLPRETSWRWAAGVGVAGGAQVAWNLRTGIEDPDQVENAIWRDSRVEAPGAAVIEPGDSWRIRAGGLDMTLDREGEQREDLNLGLAAIASPGGVSSGHMAASAWRDTGS